MVALIVRLSGSNKQLIKLHHKQWERVESAAPGRGFALKAVAVLKCTLKVRANARSYQTTKYPVVQTQSTLIF